jgi:predicted Co/Zn/Cd cation transporter (cation efflux family)
VPGIEQERGTMNVLAAALTSQELMFVILTVAVLLLLLASLAFITLRIRKVLLGLNELLQLLKRSGKIR